MQRDFLNSRTYLLIGLLLSISLSWLFFTVIEGHNIDQHYLHDYPEGAASSPRLNWSEGDYTTFEFLEGGAYLDTLNNTYLGDFNTTHGTIYSEYNEGENPPNGTLLVNRFTRLIENSTGELSMLGFYYPWQIETNVTVGSEVNIFNEAMEILEITTRTYLGLIREAWRLEFDVYNLYYDTTTGILLEMLDVDDTGMRLIDTNLISTDVHNLQVELSLPYITLIDYPTSISLTVNNYGAYDESVTIQLWFDDALTLEQAIDLPSGEGINLDVNRSFISTGEINVTAFVNSSSGEDEDWADNTDTQWIKVVSEPRLHYQLGDYLTYNFTDLFLFGGDTYFNFTYLEQVDACHVRMCYDQNGTITYPILNTVTRELIPENDSVSLMESIYFWQVETSLSIGSRLKYGSQEMEVFDETSFHFQDLILEAWIANVSDLLFYYHKNTGVLLGVGNETDDFFIELSSTNMLLNYPPELRGLADKIVEYDNFPVEFTWEVNDASPAYYIIQINGSIVEEAQWNNSNPISYTMENHPLGVYEILITVYDSFGLFTTDIVIVSVIDTTAPSISGPSTSLNIYWQTKGEEIRWQVHDVFPGYYQILRDDNVIDENEWFNEIDIVVSLNDLEVGEYVYELKVNDTSGNSASYSVLVKVKINSIGLPGLPATLLLLLESLAMIFFIQYYQRKQNSK